MKFKLIDRRTFVKESALLALSGKVLYDTLIDLGETDKENTRRGNISRIYHELPNHTYKVEASGEAVGWGFNRKIGRGIVVDNKLITCAHIADIGNIMIRTPYGRTPIQYEVENFEIKGNGHLLTEIMLDKDREVAAYKLAPYKFNKRDNEFTSVPLDFKDIGMPDFPCEISSKRDLGQVVYLIGNPEGQGHNIRKGYITDLDGYGDLQFTSKGFGLDISVISGDSGSPVVSEDFKLLGIANVQVYGLSYAIKIEEFFK